VQRAAGLHADATHTCMNYTFNSLKQHNDVYANGILTLDLLNLYYYTKVATIVYILTTLRNSSQNAIEYSLVIVILSRPPGVQAVTDHPQHHLHTLQGQTQFTNMHNDPPGMEAKTQQA